MAAKACCIAAARADRDRAREAEQKRDKAMAGLNALLDAVCKLGYRATFQPGPGVAPVVTLEKTA